MNYMKRIKSAQLEMWSSPEVKRHTQKDNRLAIIPVGSFEQHGPHCPLGTDTFISTEVSHRIALKLGGVVVPPVWFGVSDEHMDFAGTITVSPEILVALLAEITISLAASGFDNILIINGHGSNEPHLKTVDEKVREKAGRDIKITVLSYWDELPEKERQQLSSLEWGLHANEFETSIISAIFPSLVKKMKGIANFPDTSALKNQDLNEKLFKHLMKDTNGVWGDPERASIKKGRSLLAKIELSLTNCLTRVLQLARQEKDAN